MWFVVITVLGTTALVLCFIGRLLIKREARRLMMIDAMLRHPSNGPRGATIIRRNGTRIPLELIYVGIEDDLQVWESVITLDLAHGDRLVVDELPAKTVIRGPATWRYPGQR